MGLCRAGQVIGVRGRTGACGWPCEREQRCRGTLGCLYGPGISLGALCCRWACAADRMTTEDCAPGGGQPHGCTWLLGRGSIQETLANGMICGAKGVAVVQKRTRLLVRGAWLCIQVSDLEAGLSLRQHREVPRLISGDGEQPSDRRGPGGRRRPEWGCS